MSSSFTMAKHALYLLSILQAIVTAHAVCDGNSNGMCNGEICYNIEIGLIFDDYPGETKWEISQGRRNSIENENAVVLKESPYYDPEKNYAEASETHILCLPEGKYTFTIMDRNEDGMCCDNGEGRYAVTYQETGEIITHGSKYEKFETVTFQIPFATPQLVDDNGDGVEDRTKNIIPPVILTDDGMPDKCENEFGLHLQTDDYGVETTWELQERSDNSDPESAPAGMVVASGGPYTSNHTYDISYCLYPGKYTFVFMDWQCDGLKGKELTGYYQLKVNNEVVHTGGTDMNQYWEEVKLEFNKEVEAGSEASRVEQSSGEMMKKGGWMLVTMVAAVAAAMLA